MLLHSCRGDGTEEAQTRAGKQRRADEKDGGTDMKARRIARIQLDGDYNKEPPNLEGCLGGTDRKAPRIARIQLDGGGEERPSTEEQAVCLAVLKKLLGSEMREIIRDELQAVLSPGTNKSAADSAVPAAATDSALPGDQDKDAKCRSNSDPVVGASSHYVSTFENPYDEWELRAALGGEKPSAGSLARWPRAARLLRERLQEVSEKFGIVHAPNQPERLKSFVEGHAWNSVVLVVVLLNCFFMIESVNYQVRHYMDDESVGSALFWCDVLFLLFYSIEAALKFGLYRLYYFYGEGCRGNLFDFFLLLCNCWSVASTLIVSSSPALKNFTWLRLLRILRVLKTLRVLRLATHFQTLRAILFSLADSFWTLLWSILMLALIYFMFALVFVSRIATYFQEQGSHLDPLEFESLVASYGRVSRAMKSLVLVSSGGRDWGEDFVMFEPTGIVNQCFFFFFIYFTMVAVMNIILGIFVQDAMKNLQPSEAEKARELAMEEQKIENRLRELVSGADIDGTGKLEYNEWANMLKDGRLRRLFGLLGFPPHQLNQFFLMMCSADENTNCVVDIDSFVKGCIAMKGAASSFDMNAVLFEIQTMRGLMLKEIEQIRELAENSRKQTPVPVPHAASQPAGARQLSVDSRFEL